LSLALKVAGRLVLAVLRHRDGWHVFGPNGRWRHYDYKVDAEEAALRIARQAGGEASEVSILVQEPWGELRPLRDR
jgi:hypothetical protein